MNSSVLIEMIGYVGSALVLISFLMTSVVKLRVINAIGGTILPHEAGAGLHVHVLHQGRL